MTQQVSFAESINAGGSRLLRWGRDVEPVWEYGGLWYSLPPGGDLLTYEIPTGKDVYIYGYFISAEEENEFVVGWLNNGTFYTKRIQFPSKGTLYFVDNVAINEGYPANYRQGDPYDGIAIYNVNAGTGNPTGGAVYQAGLLHADIEAE